MTKKKQNSIPKYKIRLLAITTYYLLPILYYKFRNFSLLWVWYLAHRFTEI